MQRHAEGSSHAKLILLGEHSVVYGQPAIAIPLPDLAMHVRIEERQVGQLIMAPNYQGPLDDLTEAYEGVRQLISRLLTFFGQPNLPFLLRINSNIPQERGMGSSAATAIAITRAFFAFFQRPLPDATLQKWANVEEAITHGSPSGIDVATAAHDLPVWFVKQEPVRPLDMRFHGTLIIADTGIHGQTGLAVSVVREQIQTEPVTTQNHLDALGHLATDAKEALATDDLLKLGRTMNEAQAHLSALGVSHPKLDQLIRAARKAGALGAKLTGGGVGGAMFALADSPQQVVTITTALEAAGAHEIWLQQYPKN